MTPEVLSSYSEIQKLHVAEVIRYLQEHHWMSVSHPSPRLLVFEKGVDDSARRTLRERDKLCRSTILKPKITHAPKL